MLVFHVANWVTLTWSYLSSLHSSATSMLFILFQSILDRVYRCKATLEVMLFVEFTNLQSRVCRQKRPVGPGNISSKFRSEGRQQLQRLGCIVGSGEVDKFESNED